MAEETPTISTEYNGEQIDLVPYISGGEPVVFTTDENGAGPSPELSYGVHFVYMPAISAKRGKR